MTGPTHALKFGIIGCGRMGRSHTRNLHADGRGRVTALFDEDRATAEALRDQLAPDAVVVPDLNALLGDAGLDAVVICTPTTSHYEQVLACRERGLHVLCEKPLADTRERIQALVREAGRGGSSLSVGYQRRYWATYRTLRREVQSGRWGEVRAVTSHNVEDWQQTIAGTWRDDPAANWGGFVGDAGSHKIDALFYVTGLSPVEVFARTHRFDSHVEIAATVSAVLANEVPLCMDFIGHAQYLGEDLHVHCAQADLMIRDRRLWIARNGQVEEFDDLEPDSNPDAGFLDLLTGQAANIAPADCALPVFDFTRAILDSHRRGQPVDCRTSED